MHRQLRGWTAILGTFVLFAAPGTARANPCETFALPPGGILECFDEAASGSAASAGSYDGLSVIDGLVLSETDAAFLLGLDTEGWATSGDQGVLNSLLPVVDFLFDTSILLFNASFVALPGLFGEPVPVVVQGFQGDMLVQTAISDVSTVRPDGTQRGWLTLMDGNFGFDRVRLFSALAPCGGSDCEVGATTSLFVDTVKYIPGVPKNVVPEPDAAALALAAFVGLAGLVVRGREGGAR